MKIPEAIEILSRSADAGVTTFNDDFRNAERLGIEALKRVQELRDFNLATAGRILPGETKD